MLGGFGSVSTLPVHGSISARVHQNTSSETLLRLFCRRARGCFTFWIGFHSSRSWIDFHTYSPEPIKSGPWTIAILLDGMAQFWYAEERMDVLPL